MHITILNNIYIYIIIYTTHGIALSYFSRAGKWLNNIIFVNMQCRYNIIMGHSRFHNT